jgi:hypothetical protein
MLSFSAWKQLILSVTFRPLDALHFYGAKLSNRSTAPWIPKNPAAASDTSDEKENATFIAIERASEVRRECPNPYADNADQYLTNNSDGPFNSKYKPMPIRSSSTHLLIAVVRSSANMKP